MVSTKTRQEIEEMLASKDNEQKYIVRLDGGLATCDMPLDSEEEIHSYIKDYIEDFYHNYDPYGVYLELQVARKHIENNDFGNIIDVNLLDDIVVRIDNSNNMDLKYIKINYVKDNQYKVLEKDILSDMLSPLIEAGASRASIPPVYSKRANPDCPSVFII